MPGNEPSQRAALVRRYNVERSCIRCHERKVRCNKDMPCSACVRAKAECCYPGPERTKRRSQRSTQAQVAPRLDRLEKAIGALTAVSEYARPESDINWPTNLERHHGLSAFPSPPAESSTSSIRGYHAAAPKQHTTPGVLMKDGASTRYINEIMLSQMLEKETELHSAVSTPASRSSLEQRPSSFNFHGLVSTPSYSLTNYDDLHPSPGQAVRLWQIFLNNVNPLMRLLHIPTIQPVFFSAINDQSQVNPDFKALLFSIYFAAVTSLDNSEVNLILGRDRQSAVNIYQQGLEINLHAASFLDSPTLTSLQAFSIYLMCRRNHNGGLSGWVLNGLLSRAAQSVGLHRDGENFKLSPFDCEIRRRLWWQVGSIESRVAEDHGLFTGNLWSFCDTKFPLNVNDSDLSIEMTKAPESTQGWTEMTSYLIVFETNKALQETHQFLARDIDSDERATQLEKFFQDFRKDLYTKYLQYLDANIPIQKYGLFLGKIQLAKLEVLIRQQSLRGLSVEKAAELVCDENLVLVCKALEMGTQLRTDELLKSFHWLTSTFPPYFLLTYSLWHLCVRPDSQSANRAWDAIERSLKEDYQRGPANHGPKWNVVTRLREKALSIRHSYLERKTAAADLSELGNTNTTTEKLDEDMFTIALEEGMRWDLDFNLISSFQAGPPDSVMPVWPFPM